MKFLIKALMSTLLLLFVSPGWASTVYLPDFNDPIAAVRYDQFYSYSAEVLDNFYGQPRLRSDQGFLKKDVLKLWWDGSGLTGNGKIDPANPGSNNFGGFIFPDPLTFPNTGNTPTFNTDLTSVWRTTVNSIWAYLEYLESDTPVFVFDNNQQNNDSGGPQQTNGKVFITDEQGNVIITWAFDGENDSVFNPNSLVTIPESLDLGNGISFNTSGTNKADFYVYSPLMFLNQYLDKNYYFNVAFQFRNLTDGFEDVYIAGLRRTPPPVPEPATMLLLGAGLLGLTAAGRRKA